MRLHYPWKQCNCTRVTDDDLINCVAAARESLKHSSQIVPCSSTGTYSALQARHRASKRCCPCTGKRITQAVERVVVGQSKHCQDRVIQLEEHSRLDVQHEIVFDDVDKLAITSSYNVAAAVQRSTKPFPEPVSYIFRDLRHGSIRGKLWPVKRRV